MDRIVEISIKNIQPHPDSPRKDVRDVSELAESIKKNGIMQNLTIIPLDALDEEPENQTKAEEVWEESDFVALIGHRRLAAAKEAGLEKVPCKIVSNISKREQVSIMLEENMQRNDLTIWEQARGFQMMLDLGETEDSIAEKTGFSRTTVHRRLNIAKLDEKTLKSKENEDGFQLSLKDLYELEQIPDVKTRNKILRESTSSKDLSWRAKREVEEIKRKKNKKEIIKLLKANGIADAPADYEKTRYYDKWERLQEIDLDKDPPKKIKKQEGAFWGEGYQSIVICRKKDKKNKVLTKRELEEKEKEKNKKQSKRS